MVVRAVVEASGDFGEVFLLLTSDNPQVIDEVLLPGVDLHLRQSSTF